MREDRDGGAVDAAAEGVDSLIITNCLLNMVDLLVDKLFVVHCLSSLQEFLAGIRGSESRDVGIWQFGRGLSRTGKKMNIVRGGVLWDV